MDRNFVLEAVAREIHTGIALLESLGRVQYCNPFFVSSFGLSLPVEGRHIREIIKNHTLLDAVECFIGERAKRDNGGKEAVADGSGECCREEIEIVEAGRSFNIRMVLLGDTGTRSLLIFLRDITEEKRVETIKKDFVANVSHELRTPLASIKGYSETLIESDADVKKQREFLEIIDRHATRMSRIIDDLLILSRLESSAFTLVSATVDMRELINSTVKGCFKDAEDREVTIKAELPEVLPSVMGDRDRLEQVLVNLFDNAIKYTPAGGRVVVTARVQGPYVCVDVTDTGIGIPEDDISRIFERFYRVDKARSRALGGTGLGLAIVKHIIQGHNGRLEVKSRLGLGSTFSFFLRACEEPDATAAALEAR
ncbi:MAG: ATP-binding protein [Thermodesulfobacteriota bacterium]